MSKQTDEIAALRAQNKKLEDKLNKLEAKIEPTSTYPTDAEVAAHRNEMHQAREARASKFNAFTKGQLAAMHEACPNPQAIVHDQRGAPIGPASIIPRSSKPASNVQREQINQSGWQHPVSLKNGLGQGR